MEYYFTGYSIYMYSTTGYAVEKGLVKQLQISCHEKFSTYKEYHRVIG